MLFDFKSLNFILYLGNRAILGIKDLYFQIKKASVKKVDLEFKKNKNNVEFRYYSKQRPPHSSSDEFKINIPLLYL